VLSQLSPGRTSVIWRIRSRFSIIDAKEPPRSARCQAIASGLSGATITNAAVQKTTRNIEDAWKAVSHQFSCAKGYERPCRVTLQYLERSQNRSR
jgi:hypothetical protein